MPAAFPKANAKSVMRKRFSVIAAKYVEFERETQA
jgi:hypothetical protein